LFEAVVDGRLKVLGGEDIVATAPAP